MTKTDLIADLGSGIVAYLCLDIKMTPEILLQVKTPVSDQILAEVIHVFSTLCLSICTHLIITHLKNRKKQ